MNILSVFDESFRPYGKVLQGYDTAELVRAMEAIPLPESGTAYKPGIDSLEACALYGEMQLGAYGGMPIQLGMCWGHNTCLNCLEYHRDSEVNIGDVDFILLLAKQDEIVDGVLDTDRVKAFKVPAGRGLCHHPALCPLPGKPRSGLPRGGGSAEGHQHRKAGV